MNTTPVNLSKLHYKTCQCGKCKHIRGEKTIHLKMCVCCICKNKRGEYRGKNAPGFKDGRTLKKYYCIKCKITEIHYNSWFYRNSLCKICAGKLRKNKKHPWTSKMNKNKIIRRKQVLGMNIHPNKPEQILNELLKQLFKNKYKLNVKAEYIIGNKIPDFMDIKNKKIIELFGDYWHSDKVLKEKKAKDSTEQGRIKFFKKYSYSTLIIWEHELKDIEAIIAKIMEFDI